jgi:hypothetical protein
LIPQFDAATERFAQMILFLVPGMYIDRKYVSLVRDVLPLQMRFLWFHFRLTLGMVTLQACERCNAVYRNQLGPHGCCNHHMSLTSLADNKMHQILQAEYMRTIYASQEFIPGAKKYTGGCSSCGRSGHTRINKDCPNQQKLRLKDLLLDSSKCDRKHYVFLNNLPTGHDSAEDNQARPIFEEASAATARGTCAHWYPRHDCTHS